MTGRARLILVLLQLAIGWHLLYEGYWKIQQKDNWSSRGYLRGATGPFALPIRWLAGDPEVSWQNSEFVVRDTTQDFLVRFMPQPADPNNAPENKPYKQMPAALVSEWQAYFDRFVEHYQLNDADPERRDQRKLAEVKFINSMNKTAVWILKGEKGIEKPLISGPPGGGKPKIPDATPNRVQEYLAKLQEIKTIKATEVETFGSKVAPKLRQAEAEAAALKRGLEEDLKDQFADMKASLREVLTPQQRRMSDVPDDAGAPAAPWPRLPLVDNTVKWGLVVIGACLLLGLCTRTACVAGALLLLLFYLAMPPLPGLADATSKSHYLIVNDNLIEILALLTVASTRPASRYGLDAWLQMLLSGCCRERTRAGEAREERGAWGVERGA
jgi:uncharacterized membrane protein YphA (DoxX/SURF4 family)